MKRKSICERMNATYIDWVLGEVMSSQCTNQSKYMIEDCDTGYISSLCQECADDKIRSTPHCTFYHPEE